MPNNILRPESSLPDDLNPYSDQSGDTGLSIARGRTLRIENPDIDRLEQQARGGILRRREPTLAKGADVGQVEKYAGSPQKIESTFSQSELAVLAMNPELFVQQVITQKWARGFETRPFGAEILAQLRALPERQLSYYENLSDNDKKEYRKTLDTAFAVIVRIARTAQVADQAPRLLNVLNKLLTHARRDMIFDDKTNKFEHPLDERDEGIVPFELPSTTEALIEMLPSLSSVRGQETRRKIYRALGQLPIPSLLSSQVLETMEQFGELNHPLAYRLTVEQAQRAQKLGKPTEWMKHQERMRQELLLQLDGTPQALFENFETLLAQSEGLIISSDLMDPQPGKIGLEIEGGGQWGQERFMNSQFGDEEGQNWIEQQPEFVISWDYSGSVTEIKKRATALEHDAGYQHSLADLSTWISENLTDVRDLHIHLDQERHPFPPSLGELLSTSGVEFDHSVFVDGDYVKTWQAWGILPPRYRDLNIDPARLDDVLVLHTYAAEEQTHDPIQIEVNSTQDIHSWKQLIFGHICVMLGKPEARLAGLLLLQDDYFFRYFNPAAMANSYALASLPHVATYLKSILTQIYPEEPEPIPENPSAHTIQGRNYLKQCSRLEKDFTPPPNGSFTKYDALGYFRAFPDSYLVSLNDWDFFDESKLVFIQNTKIREMYLDALVRVAQNHPKILTRRKLAGITKYFSKEQLDTLYAVAISDTYAHNVLQSELMRRGYEDVNDDSRDDNEDDDGWIDETDDADDDEDL